MVTHLLRREYGTFRLANTDAITDDEYVLRLRQYAANVPEELPPLGVSAPPAALSDATAAVVAAAAAAAVSVVWRPLLVAAVRTLLHARTHACTHTPLSLHLHPWLLRRLLARGMCTCQACCDILGRHPC